MKPRNTDSSVSFPVTIWYAADTGLIHVERKTDPTFQTTVRASYCKREHDDTLFDVLFHALADAGKVSEKEKPREHWK